MYSNTNQFSTNWLKRNFRQETRSNRATLFIICFSLLLSWIALSLFMTLPNKVWASDTQDIGSHEKIDARWVPWIGPWRLVLNKVDTSESNLEKEYLLTINAGDNKNSITMKGYRDKTPLAEEEIIADGRRHQFTNDKCTGWYQYSWSETGKRLLLNSELNCQDDPARVISGMSIINKSGDWLDIQLLQNGEERAINIRKYRNVDKDSVTLGHINANQVSSSRNATGTSFSINEIIELSSKVESEVLEAALLEMGEPFPINSKQLARLGNAEVPSRIVDLMVALSFPDKFSVEGEAVSLSQGPEAMVVYPYFQSPYYHCSYAHPFFPWHWASSACSPYGYSYLGWRVWPGYYYPFWPPYYYEEGGGGHGGSNGRLIKGHGYTRAKSGNSVPATRYAVPRNAPVNTTTTATSPAITPSSSSSGGSSGATANSPANTQPSASPRGYRSGNR